MSLPHQCPLPPLFVPHQSQSHRVPVPCPQCPLTVSPVPGIHYVGQLHEGSLLRVALDQVTDGQLCWHRLPDPYDEVTLGDRRYLLRSGKVAFVTALEEQFPAEKEAIREFMKLSKVRVARPQGGDTGWGWWHWWGRG